MAIPLDADSTTLSAKTSHMSQATSISSAAVAMTEETLSIRFLYRPIVFMEPERVVAPASWLDHTPFAFWIVDALRPSTFVELGCQSGNSYASFAQAVQILGLPAACYGVDTWRGDPHAGFFDETVFEEWSAYHDRRFSTFSQLIRATFDQAVEHFADGSIDLLHIDGYHTFEAVSHDFEAWRSKLSQRGVVVCHDINVRERDFGAWRLWERLRDDYPSFEFLHGHGLGVLGIGHDLPDAVSWLLSLRSHSPESVNNVRLFFSRLGAAVLGRYTAAEARQTLRGELTARDEQLAHATGDVARLSSELAESNRQLAALQVEATQRQADLEHLAQATGDVARLSGELAESNRQLAALQVEARQRTADLERLAQATGDVARLSDELAESERRLAADQAGAARLRDALRAADETLAMRAAEAERLRSSIGSREAELEQRAHEIAQLLSKITVLDKHVSARSADLDARDAQIVRLKRDVESAPRALSARDRIIRKLDSEAAAVLELLQRETDRLKHEAARRKGLEAILCWSRAPVSAQSNRGPSGLTKTPATLRTVSRFLAAALQSTGHRPGALAQILRIAAVPSRLGDFRVIEASGLFDEAYYLERNPEVTERRMNPLVHFVIAGAAEGRDPHPLFSTAFYLGQLPDLAASGQNALQHYLTQGWRTGCAPHPVFDPAYYIAQNPDVIREGCDPLSHYLQYGAATRRSPHPLFDIDFYLRENQDVVDAGIEPLTHFLVKGAREGRRPNPLFDCAYYLEAYPEVAATGASPLEHFIRFGWREGKNPSAAFDVQHYLERNPDVRASGENPLVHYLLYGQGRQAMPGSQVSRARERLIDTSRIELTACSLAPQADRRPTILVVSHVGPWRPRAGNEYRVRRMLCWYQRQGYRIIPVIAPLPGEELPREGVERTAAEFGNVIQCHRDGRVEYVFRDLPDVLASLNGMFTSSFADLLGEDAGGSPRERDLLKIERTFCHDAVISTVLHLERSLGPHVLLVEYIWMTRFLPLVRGDVLKVIDTHDVFSSIQQKVTPFGIRDVVIEPHEEAERLRRADLAIAIQDDERAELKRLAPLVPVVTAGVDFDVVSDRRAPTEGQILYVASNNARNRKGLDDFLRLAWPRIHHVVPRAELLVLGTVADTIATREAPGVRAMAPEDDLTARYRDAALVIDPAVAGTGLKIKVLEALCHFRPVVTWPTSVEGLDPKLAAFCLVARDWYEFSEQVISVLTRPPGAWFTAEDRAVIAEFVAPEHVYASLDSAFRAFFDQHGRATEPVRVTRSVRESPIGG
jgi:Methyltransferase domain/Glycosyl transferases group 1